MAHKTDGQVISLTRERKNRKTILQEKLDKRSLNKLLKFDLLRGRTRRFSYKAYLLRITPRTDQETTFYFFLDELSEKGIESPADERAFKALNVVSRISQQQYLELVLRAKELLLKGTFQEVDDLDALFRPTSSTEDARQRHQELEEHLGYCMFDGLLKRMTKCTKDEAGKAPFIILDKKSYIEKFGGITVGVRKEILEELLSDCPSPRNAERNLDERVAEYLRGMSSLNLCILPPSGRLQQQIYFNGFPLKLYVLRFPDLTKELESYEK
ncbi:hypothetical protein [Paenibacillus sp. GYB003]|uniref:hypothetical protein n=1 Tax=Paenibacillus sp. GYB003 TaxID=2994392 RepID=UPI002F964795